MATEGQAGRRRRAHRSGLGAEWTAIVCLRLKGYRILARRYLVAGGEIDVIASRGTTIVFVEVKMRATMEDALVSIDAAKRRRMARAARVFISRQRLAGLTLRADAIYCAPWRWPRHIPAAFELALD